LYAEHLYESLCETGTPTLETTPAILKAIGFPKHDEAARDAFHLRVQPPGELCRFTYFCGSAN
jgi:hypothetical protein